jgi:hypothetical protein
MSEKNGAGGVGPGKPAVLPPRPSFSARPRVIDDKLQAIDDLLRTIKDRLGIGLTLARDNPGKTPPSWSLKARTGKAVLTFGLIDRTFFWTWDEGVSNHYSKDAETMSRIILAELVRNGHIVRPVAD